jgi:predicted secreted hydrolase
MRIYLRSVFHLIVSGFSCVSLISPVLATEFRPALPGYQYSFPRDHNAHPEFATEWWYYTGHLKSRDGRKWGYQLTWFRTALAPEVKRKSKWATRDIMFAHFALTDEKGKRFFFTDQIGRANIGLNRADTNSKTPRIWCGNWKLQFSGKKGEFQSFQAKGISDATDTKGLGFSINLKVHSSKPPVINGVNGVSQKSAGRGRASHYYSYTDLQSSGTISVGNETLQVTGKSWLDREWGSSQLAQNQVGWDWFSLRLSDGRQLMLYRLRLKNGGVEPFSSGTLVEKDGRSRHLKLRDFSIQTSGKQWKSPQTGGVYPLSWRLSVPSAKIALDVQANLQNQELIPQRSGRNLAYWEGSVSAQGNVEMTGYAKAFAGTF